MRARRSLTAAALCLALVPWSAPTTARATGSAYLDVTTPLTAVEDMVVDSAHGRVFVSGQGANGSTIAVVRFDGTSGPPITALTNPTGMAVAGNILWVGSSTQPKIFTFDLSTDPPTKTATVDTSTYGNPKYLEAAGGRVWFTYDCGVASVNLDRTLGPAITGADCPDIRSAPGSPNLMMASSGDYYSGYDYTYDVSGPSPGAPQKSGRVAWDPLPLPGGVHFVGHGVYGYGVTMYRISDNYGPLRSWSGCTGNFTLTDANGGMLACAGNDPVDPQVSALLIYDLSAPTIRRVWSGMDWQRYLVRFAFSDDGGKLFGLVAPAWPATTYSVRIMTVGKRETTLSLESQPPSVPFGTSTNLTADLEGAKESTVTIWREAGASDVQVASGTTDAMGQFSTAVSPDANTRYYATYAGDTAHDAATSANVDVAVRPLVGASLRGGKLVGDVREYAFGKRVYLDGSINPPKSTRLRLVYQRQDPSGWHTRGWATFKTAADGTKTIFFSGDWLGTATWRARWAFEGDTKHAPGRSGWVMFRYTK